MTLVNWNTPAFEARRDAYPSSGYNWIGNPPEWSLNEPQPETTRVLVNKTTHRIRFESETETEVTVVIEPKETNHAT